MIKTLPFKFTGKERDEETGLYYYGARYLDPRTSRWLSTDPALTDYIPMAPVDDNARKHNQNLPGMGGIYNSINMHLYHYYCCRSGCFMCRLEKIELCRNYDKMLQIFIIVMEKNRLHGWIAHNEYY